MGIRHPLVHCRGVAIQDLRQHGVRVDVLAEAPCFEAAGWEDSTLQKCYVANEVCSTAIHAYAVRSFTSLPCAYLALLLHCLS